MDIDQIKGEIINSLILEIELDTYHKELDLIAKNASLYASNGIPNTRKALSNHLYHTLSSYYRGEKLQEDQTIEALINYYQITIYRLKNTFPSQIRGLDDYLLDLTSTPQDTWIQALRDLKQENQIEPLLEKYENIYSGNLNRKK